MACVFQAPTVRLIDSEKAWENVAALTSWLHLSEAETLTGLCFGTEGKHVVRCSYLGVKETNRNSFLVVWP
jgi:hypothetical protein